MPNYVKAAESSSVKGKTGYSVKVNNIDIVLFKSDGKVYAFKDKCPHQGAPLSDGYVRDGCVVCLYHGWKFNLQDGSFINNKTLKLKQYPVEEENGEIYVMID